MNDLPTLELTDFPTLDVAIEQLNSQPQPCDQQPGEPLDRYRWFQIYLALPPPRRHESVAEIAGLRPGTRLIAKASHEWRWPQRIAAAERSENGFYALQREWRTQLLRETAYLAQFTGLEDASRALTTAAIGELDRAAARRCLDTLNQYQRGLLTLIEPRRKEKDVTLRINEEKLHGMVLDRRLAIAGKLFKLQYEAFFGPTEWDYDPIVGGLNRQTEERPCETNPWSRQPRESDQHFCWFQFYLSLKFFQSTAQVAKMAGIRHSTLARIARKWNWQERAAAFDAYHAGEPLARIKLQLQLLHDKAFDAHLHGLLDSTRALETAEIGGLGRATARQFLSPLLRRQRSFLQSFWRQYEAIEGKSADDHRDLLLASLVEEKAIQMLREEEEDEKKNKNLRRAYGSKNDAE